MFTIESNRKFNCRYEELPMICGFVAESLTRDLTAFASYSPKFTNAYVNDFQASIDAVMELVLPKEETTEVKLITEHINETMYNLTTQLNRLEGYLELAGKSIPVSATDFGIVPTRRKMRLRDTEAVLQNLRIVENNIKRYQAKLAEQGMSDEFAQSFDATSASLTSDTKKRYELVSNRAEIVQNNMGQLNALYEQSNEICKIGKVLYKRANPAKLKDYTFSHLLKQIRRTTKATPTPPPNAVTASEN